MPDGTHCMPCSTQGGDAILDVIEKSGLRGRGGAGFRTGMKWRFCEQAKADEHYVVCNADEGEPGTFKDRVLLNSYADSVFEGMTLCAGMIGARRGYLYLRGEYRYLLEPLEAVLHSAVKTACSGSAILGMRGFRFRHRDPPRCRRLYLRRGIGTDRVAGRQARHPAHPPAIPGDPWLPATSRPWSTMSRRSWPPPESPRSAPTGSVGRHDGIHRHQAAQRLRRLRPARHLRIPVRRHHPAGPGGLRRGRYAGRADRRRRRAHPAGWREFDRRIAFEDVATGGSFMVFDAHRDLLDMVAEFRAFLRPRELRLLHTLPRRRLAAEDLVDKLAAGTRSALRRRMKCSRSAP